MTSAIAVVAEEVGEGGELLVQVLSECVEFTLDCSGGWLLGCCGVPGVSGGSKVWVATGTPNVVNGCKGMSCLLLVNSLCVVNLFQQGPGLFQFPGSVRIGSRS